MSKSPPRKTTPNNRYASNDAFADANEIDQNSDNEEHAIKKPDHNVISSIQKPTPLNSNNL